MGSELMPVDPDGRVVITSLKMQQYFMSPFCWDLDLTAIPDGLHEALIVDTREFGFGTKWDRDLLC